MTVTIEEIAFYSIILFAVGALITYLILNLVKVDKRKYEGLQRDLSLTQNDLDTQKALVSQFATDKTILDSNLRKEQLTNKEQENQITSLQVNLKHLTQQYGQERETNLQQQNELNSHKESIASLKEDRTRQDAQNSTLLEKLETQKDDILKMQKNSEKHFENIANRLLEEKTQRFSETNQKNMKQILDPLNAKIKEFEQKVESTNKESIDRHSGLKEMIGHLSEQSKQVAQDANNLAKALKGDFKQQGNWGELVLQSILDRSGLTKGDEYETQVSERDEEGRLFQPDIVIKLPDNKRLIVDSKVSLVAYDQLIAAVDQDEALKHEKNHSIAIKNHINNLSSKNYHDLYQIESPDFVLMFIPIDTAFSSALRQDPTLFDYAFSKNVIIVTASTLLATLKTVETLWKNDKQNRYAQDIAAEAGKMYDKFVGFMDDMEKMGNQINTVKGTFEKSMNKLHTGSGNLVKRAEKIKELGANANKALPGKLIA